MSTTEPVTDNTAPARPDDATSTEQDPGHGAEQQPESGNAEAARYRRQLRDTQAERDGLAARVEVLQRAEITRLAGEQRLTRPEALWATGAAVADFLDAEGNIDAAKVTDAARAAIDTLGLATTPATPEPNFGQGTRPGQMPGIDQQHTSWSQVISGPRLTA